MANTIVQEWCQWEGMPPPVQIVQPMVTANPTVLILTSTNPNAVKQLQETVANFQRRGFEPLVVPAMDGARVPYLQRSNVWRRAMSSWGLVGMPYSIDCIHTSMPTSPIAIINNKVCFTRSEDSCKFFNHIHMRDFLQILREAPVEAEIVQAGCRAFVKGAKMHLLHLEAM